MKRVAAALVMLGVGTALGAPAGAATLGGSAHLVWTVGSVTSVSLITDYSAATVQGTTLPTEQASGAGTCAAATGSESANTLTFGMITPPTTAYQGCSYPNAIALGVQSNDSNGYKIYEYANAVPTGTTFCAFPNDTTMNTNATMSSRTAPAAATGTATCATGGTALAAMTGTATGSGYGAPGTAVANGTSNATPTFIPWTSGGYNFVSYASSSPTVQWAGQDVQINVNNAAASGTPATTEIIFAVVPN